MACFIGGGVTTCPWFTDQSSRIGNVLEKDLEDIMSGDKIKKIQESILDGSFRYCDPQLCTWISNNTLPDLSTEEIEKIISEKYPDEFNISYDDTCNHACPSCRRGFFLADSKYYTNVDAITEKMMPYFNKAHKLSINGRGEVFSSRHMMAVLEQLRPEREDFELCIETNAALFDETHWQRIQHLGRYKIGVVITIQSFINSTYRALSGYANHVDQLMKNLNFIKDLRKKNILNNLTISMIVQESNFRELPEFISRCLNEFLADNIRIRGIIRFSMPEEEYWYKDVFNPLHPFYKEAVEVLHHPILQDPRVWYWEGDYENGRKAVEHPLRKKVNKLDAYYKWLCKLELHENRDDLYNAWKEKYGSAKIAIYGMGNMGKILLNELNRSGIRPKCIIDKADMDSYEDIPFYPANALCHVNELGIDVVIVTAIAAISEIREQLLVCKYKGCILSIEDLL